MTGHANQIDFRNVFQPQIKFPGFGYANTEFMLLHSCRNVGMCLWIDIGIGSN